MNPTIAQAKLMALHANTASLCWTDAVVNFTNNNVPVEVITRLEELWGTTKVIGNQVYEVGKILVMKIIEFIVANPQMAIGAVIGAAVGSLTHAIPWIGPMLAPLTMAIGSFFGAVAGHRLDKIAKGELDSFNNSNIFADLVTAAKAFWLGIVEIFKALRQHFQDEVKIVE
ncbi:MAG: hypothetical protein OEY11_04635 [Gammaproteobacteria bacterium]|nr:hypothetical protein [Gammaproteobacteria bacterium]